MTKETDTSAEDVKRLRKLLSYGLPPHVGVQTGEGTSSPNAVFADADYEIGDGVCGIHSSGKQANEPCIPYIRADALIHSLAERDEMKSSCEFWERCAVKNEKRWKKAEAERDLHKARAERAEAALRKLDRRMDTLETFDAVVHETVTAALAQTNAEPASGMYGQYTPVTVSSRSEPITRDDARDLTLVDEPGQTNREVWEQVKEAAADELMVEALACEGNLSVEKAQAAIRAMPYPGDAQAALDARDKRVRGEALEETLPVAGALAAAISLLEKGGKKAAPSDKMFEQMLADYQKTLDEYRATLARIEAEPEIGGE